MIKKLEMPGNDLDWKALAALFELLSMSFRYPDRELIDALVSGEYKAALSEMAETLKISFPDEVISKLSVYEQADPELLFHALRAEATRLFIGAPKPLVSPYEGVWRSKADGDQALLFLNPYSIDVEVFYRTYGLGQPEGKNEPLDHVSTELEFLQYVSMLEAGMLEAGILDANVMEEGLNKNWSTVFHCFMEEHIMTWMPRFADATISESRESFYNVAATILNTTLQEQLSF